MPPRIRTIKPEFFTSEDICALSPLARLLYIATWCEADREGRLEWKPGTWKLRYFPADDFDIVTTAAELVARGLVVKYGDGIAYLPTFTTHQYINGREAESRLPDPPADLTVTRHDAWPTRADACPTRDDASSTRADACLTRADACPTRAHGNSLPFPSHKKEQGVGQKPDAGDVARFEAFWGAYPRKVAKTAALKAWQKLAPDEALVGQMLAAVAAQIRSEGWTRDAGAFIPHPATWINGRRWEDVIAVATPVVDVHAAADAERRRTVAILERREALLAAVQQGGRQ